MIALNILEVKNFMGQLLLHEVFDNFLVSELEILTANQYKINGRINKNWLDDREKEELSGREYSLWKELKGFAYQIIKGNKTPQMMKLVFRLSAQNTERILKRAGYAVSPDEVEGLFINIHYEKEELVLITGTSLKTFTLDKIVEREWDENVRQFLKYHKIAFEK